MKKLYVVFFLLWGCLSYGQGQRAGSGSFKQDLHLNGISGELSSSGFFKYHKELGVLLHYQMPFEYYVVFSKNKIIKFNENGEYEETEELPHNYNINEVMAYFLSGDQNIAGDISQVFEISQEGDVISLKVMDENMGQVINDITIKESENQREIYINKPNKDQENWRFIFDEQNQEISASEKEMLLFETSSQ